MGLRRLEFIGLFFCKSLTTLEITENRGFKCRPDEEGIETPLGYHHAMRGRLFQMQT